MKYNLGGIVEVEKKTINPQKTPNDHYCVYSLPGFDNGKAPERLTGSKILSNKIIIDRENYILFNKLNLKFKRVWRFKNDGENNVCSTEFLPLYTTNNDKVDLDYLYYSLINDGFYARLVGQNSGTSNSHQRIHKEDLLSMEIDLPDLEVQQKIVRILSVLDQKIELNNQESENLHKIIKTLYGNTATSIKEKTKLADLAKISSGKRPASIETNGEYVVVGARDVMGFTNEYNQEPEVIITGRVGTLGVIKRYPRKIWASDNTLIVDTRYKNYIECYLSSVDFGAYNRGSTQPLITQTDLKNFVLPFDKEKCDSFEDKTASLRNKMFAIEEQNEGLIMLRDTLLPRLIEGTVDLNKVGL